ncbi:tRNA (cytidine/uridine-2'-O-)-methyltransferase TrmJ [Nymphon striatum]|nr:tRNA (cytidine/uridine-2'-O-)-methyltransferase TrmJ [Nymphon striatum]
MSNAILDNIRIVMIHTSHPGNIGAAARAMKVMGLSDLCLVNPKSFPDDQATAMSANATDILDNTKVVSTLADAIADCQLVIGSSARHERTLSWDIQDSRECGETISQHARNAKVALLFGRESSGLTNDELAPALQSEAESDVKAEQDHKDEQVTSEELDGFFQHLKQVMEEVEFLDPENPKHLMTRLRRLYSRSSMTRSELNIQRGFLAAITKEKERKITILSPFHSAYTQPSHLKAVANAVHNKVHIGSPVSSSPKNDLYSLNQSFKQKTDNQSTPKFVQDFEALLIETQKQTKSQTQSQNSHSGLQRVSFNYDVTASDFWTDLDTTRLESAIEESDRHDFEASLLGAPLESEYHQQLEEELMPLNDSIYTLKTTPTRI